MSSSLQRLLLCALVLQAGAADFHLNILHTNDMHSRFEQTNQRSSKCGEKDAAVAKCYGGFARVCHVVKEARRRAEEGENPPVLFLNAGDTYQGTVWFSVHKWRIVARLSSMLGIDASSLGNHEFDDGVSGLVPYINNVSYPVLASNLDLSGEPTLAATHLAKTVVLTVRGKRVGVIGYLTTETKDISSTGHVVFRDEVESVKEQAAILKKEGVTILVALGHAGYEMDKRIAAEVPDIDLVVGGHTNTFLYTGTPPDPSDAVEGQYPTVVKQRSGRRVPVVQAYAYTKYIGNLSLIFDDFGELKSWAGNPILLDKTVPQDADLLRELGVWRAQVQEQMGTALGTSRVLLNGDQRLCRVAECNMGNLITDAMVDYYISTHNPLIDGWSEAPIALQNGGGIRGSIDTINDNGKRGIVTMADLLTTLPFDNSITVLKLRGETLLEVLEWSVHSYIVNSSSANGAFLQVAGLQVKYDICKPPGKRVSSALARCGKCHEPVYKPINRTQIYGVLVPSYIANGGDGFKFDKYISQDVLDITDTGALGEYIKKYSPIYPGTEGRVSFAEMTCVGKPANSAGVVTSNFSLVLIAAAMTIKNEFLLYIYKSVISIQKLIQ